MREYMTTLETAFPLYLLLSGMGKDSVVHRDCVGRVVSLLKIVWFCDSLSVTYERPVQESSKPVLEERAEGLLAG